MAFSLTLKKVFYSFTSLLNQLVKSFLKKKKKVSNRQGKQTTKNSPSSCVGIDSHIEEYTYPYIKIIFSL